ncbi:hypothetical protein AcV7_001819 [Taiwanofungus camphoratus]|nr:hypothetical protein AcV7_001819 [Antrodia cinnamomea]
MGGASSKPARQFPKTKPHWTGARTENAPSPRPTLPKASETKNEAIERDSRDPQFMANLNQLGPVKVNHHMQTIRPAADRTQRIFQARQQSEAEARSSQSTHNRMLAASLHELLEERKSISSMEELNKLAKRYDIDITKLQSVARFVNSPSVAEGTVKRTVGDDGAERITWNAAWVKPDL